MLKCLFLAKNSPEIEMMHKMTTNETVETIDTGVIYKITNTTNGKFYVGKADSYEKHGKQPPSKYGGAGRLRRHLSNAHSNNEETSHECPIFYEAIRNSNKEDWNVETLAVCSKKHMKEYETRHIKNLKSYLPEIGYNYFVADNKPIDGPNKEEYEKKKAATNRERAIDGKMKRNDNKLPANVYKRTSTLPNGNVINGYFVQIKVGTKLINKAFMSQKDNDQGKLDKAKEFLAKIKQENNL